MNFKIEFELSPATSEIEAAIKLRELADRIENIHFSDTGNLTIYSEVGNPIGKAQWTNS